MQYNESRSKNFDDKKTVVKPGRTLLVKLSTTIDDTLFNNLDGFQTKYFAEKSTSYFLTFATAEQSFAALKTLKHDLPSNTRIKFAHYRVYFTITGLTNTSDYNTVKTSHINLITGCNVLYYRLYRKNDAYLGCGDMTVDTKEGFDNMMTELKNYTFGEYSGVHYRYNKTKPDEFSQRL